jgi:hypothetical protein
MNCTDLLVFSCVFTLYPLQKHILIVHFTYIQEYTCTIPNTCNALSFTVFRFFLLFLRSSNMSFWNISHEYRFHLRCCPHGEMLWGKGGNNGLPNRSKMLFFVIEFNTSNSPSIQLISGLIYPATCQEVVFFLFMQQACRHPLTCDSLTVFKHFLLHNWFCNWQQKSEIGRHFRWSRKTENRSTEEFKASPPGRRHIKEKKEKKIGSHKINKPAQKGSSGS